MAEWLAQITPETPYQEMLDRPSAFNPMPEQMPSGDFKITPVGTLDGRSENTRHYIQYGTGDIYEVEWPVYQAVKPGEAETKRIDATDEEPGHQAEAAMTLDRFDYFWESQAAALAGKRLMNDGRTGFDKAFNYAAHRGIFADPRNFIQYASKVFEFSLKNDMPATAYAVAKTAFTGVMAVRGTTLRCHGLRHWLDENVTHVIEPGISQALRNTSLSHTETEREDIMRIDRLRRDIAMQALDLAQYNWIMRSLKRADEHYADKNPALTEKIIWHQIMTGKQSITTVQKLADSMNSVPKEMRATTSMRPENQTPQQIGSYVLDILN